MSYNEILRVYDRDHKMIADLDFSKVISPKESESLDGEYTFEFSYPLGMNGSEDIIEGNSVLIYDMDNNYQHFEIIEVEIDVDVNESMKHVYCEHIYYSLGTEDLITFDANNDSVPFVMNTILNKSQYRLGDIEFGDADRVSISFYKTNPLKAIKKLANEIDAELSFYSSVHSDGTIRNYINVLQSRGEFIGKRFEFGYDLENIKIKTDKSLIKTALYGWGKGEEIEGEETKRLTFSDIEWKEDEGRPTDKPLGQTYVGDEDARLKYGRYNPETQEYEHIFGEYESQAETKDGLLWATWHRLNRTNKPLINIEGSVADLERVSGFEHERVRLGDRVYVIVRDLEPLETRVMRIDRDKKDPSNTNIELGNFRPLSSDKVNELSDVLSNINSRKGVWDRASNAFTPDGKLPNSVLQDPIDSTASQISLGGGTVVGGDDGLFIMDKPSIEDSLGLIRGVSFNGESALVVGKRDNTTDEFEYRVGMTSDGFKIFGEEVIAGTLRADRVKIEGDTNFYWNGNSQYAIDPDNPNRQIRWGAYKYDSSGNPVYGIGVTTNGGSSWVHEIGFDGVKIGGTGTFEGSIRGVDSSEIVDSSNRTKKAIDSDGKIIGEVTGDVTGTISGKRADVLNFEIEEASNKSGNALVLATEADTKADQADSKANEASNKADQASNKAQEADTKADQADSKATEASNKADQADSKATEAEVLATNADENALVALTETESYRVVGVPSNRPTPRNVEITKNNNGTRDITLSWNRYTQGEKKADMLIIYWTEGTSAPLPTDSSVILSVNESGIAYHTFEGVNPEKRMSFGIASARKTKDGLEIGTINTNSSWTNVNPDSIDFSGRIDGVDSSTIVEGSDKIHGAINNNNEVVSDVKSRMLPTLNVGTPSSSGLYMGRDYLGFYNNGWQSYIKNDGTFRFSGSGNNVIAWTGSHFYVRGRIIATGGSSIDYGNVSGDKPPQDADSTRTAIDNGLITTGALVVSNDGTTEGVRAGIKADGNIRFWAGEEKDRAQFGNWFVTNGGTMYTRRSYSENGTLGHFTYTSGNAGGRSKYSNACQGVLEHSLLTKSKLEDVEVLYTEMVGDKIDVKELSEDGERGISTNNLQIKTFNKSGLLKSGEEIFIEIEETSFIPKINGDVDAKISNGGIIISNVTDENKEYSISYKYIK